MKKNKYNNQLPPHLFSYWIKGSEKPGVVIKKKIITNITININDKKDKNDSDDDNIINQLNRFIISIIYLMRKIKIDCLII